MDGRSVGRSYSKEEEGRFPSLSEEGGRAKETGAVFSFGSGGRGK